MSVRRGLWLGLWCLILPVSLYFLQVVAFGLNLLDLSSTTGNIVLVVSAGGLAGAIVSLAFGLRDWRILIPTVATGLIGLGLYPLLETATWPADNETPAYVLVWLGQSVALYASVWFSSRTGVAGPDVDETEESREIHLV